MTPMHQTTTAACLSLHEYDDRGIGKAVILAPGPSMDRASWSHQTAALLAAGYRVITYTGPAPDEPILRDIHSRAADLYVVIDSLRLADVALVAHSEGTVDIARYLARFGSIGVSKVALIAPTLPALPGAGLPAYIITDIEAIDVSTLIVHGDNDQILPVDRMAVQLAGRIRGARLVIIEGGGNDIIATHSGQVNHVLISFLR